MRCEGTRRTYVHRDGHPHAIHACLQVGSVPHVRDVVGPRYASGWAACNVDVAVVMQAGHRIVMTQHRDKHSVPDTVHGVGCLNIAWEDVPYVHAR